MEDDTEDQFFQDEDAESGTYLRSGAGDVPETNLSPLPPDRVNLNQLSRISETEEITENPVAIVDGDFRFNHSKESVHEEQIQNDDDISLCLPQHEIPVPDEPNNSQNICDESVANRSRMSSKTSKAIVAQNVPTNVERVLDASVSRRLANINMSNKQVINDDKNSSKNFTLRNTSKNFSLHSSSRNQDKSSFFDSNLAGSFKCGDAAVEMFKRDAEQDRAANALRLPSNTFNSQLYTEASWEKEARWGEKSRKDESTNTKDEKSFAKNYEQRILPSLDKTAIPTHVIQSTTSNAYNQPSSSYVSERIHSRCVDTSVVPIERGSVNQFGTTTIGHMQPTFLLNCSKKGSQGPPLIDVDKPCMYFGFRPLEVESTDVLNINNLMDCSVIIRCRLKPTKSDYFKLLYKGETKQRIRARGKHSISIIFRPKQASRYKATLQIDCISEHNDTTEYTCQILGFGGQAMVCPSLTPQKKARNLVMSAGGRWQLIPSSISKFSFQLENKGARDAFACIILHDLNGEEIPSEHAFVQPANLLLDKCSQTQKKVEVRMFVQNFAGSRQTSFTTNTSRVSSAMNNTSTSNALPAAFRILILWGEERQRQRLKMIEKRKREKFLFLNRHFTVSRFDGEQSAWDDASDELLSQEDYRMFEGYLRITIIEVLDKSYSRRAELLKSRPASATGNTVIELEPDNTLKMGQSMFYSSVGS